MASRRQQLLLDVQMMLNKAQLAKEANEIRSLLNNQKVDIDFDSPEFEEKVREVVNKMSKEAMTVIGKGFNAALAAMGQNPIDMSKLIEMPNDAMWRELGSKAGQLYGKGFSDALREALRGSVSDVTSGDASSIDDATRKQFAELLRKRNDAIAKRDEVAKRMFIKRTEAQKIDKPYQELISNESGVAIDESFVDRVYDSMSVFMDINDELLSLEEKGKVNASKLKAWIDAAKELSLIYNTIVELRDKESRLKSSMEISSESIRQNEMGALISKIGKANMDYFFGGQYEDDMLSGGDIVEDFIDSRNEDVSADLDKAKAAVSELDSEIAELTSKHPELIDEQSALEAEERLNRIYEAYQRLFYTQKNKNGINQRSLSAIESALKYTPVSEGVSQITKDMTNKEVANMSKMQDKAISTLNKLAEGYVDSEGQSWEQRAQHLLKFVREYESQMKNSNIKQDAVSGYKELYEQLKPMAKEAENMLQNVYNMANNLPSVDVNSDDAQKVADAETRAAKAAETKAKASDDAAEANRKAAEEAEKERLAQENAAKVQESRRRQLVDAINEQGYTDKSGLEITDIATLKSNLSYRQSLFKTLQDENLVTDDIRESYETINKEIQEKISLLETANRVTQTENKEVEEQAQKYDALIKKAAQYNSFSDFTRQNIKELKDVGIKSSVESEALWRKAKYQVFTPIELSKEDAIQILRDKVPDSILDGWFRNGDSSYKKKLENIALSDSEIRNAALNIMWSNFKEFSGKDIGFEEFLHSEIPVYRGKNKEKYVDGDGVLSFSFDKKIAEKFGQYILETIMRPIETIGSYQTTAETEVFMRRDELESRQEYQQWHANMAGEVNATTQAIKQQEAAQQQLNAAENANPPAQSDAEAHAINTSAINAEIQAQEKLNKTEEQNQPTQSNASLHNANADAISDEAMAANELLKKEEEQNQSSQKELDVTKQITSELEKQQKLLLYRRVEGQVDLSRISNSSGDALYNKQGKNTIQDALEMDYAGYGDGLYGSVFSSAQDLIPVAKEGPVSFFAFDVSDYNLYINKTVEQAEALRTFLLSIQKLVGGGTLLDTSKLTHIEDLSEQQLFEMAQHIFENFSMTKEQFYSWLENAKSESDKIAKLFANGEVPDDKHNFGTRFMKALGYEGVLNQTGDSEYDGNTHGSVVYDPNIEDIRKNARIFNNEQEFADYIIKGYQEHKKNIDVVKREAVSYDELREKVEAYFKAKQQVIALQNEGNFQEIGSVVENLKSSAGAITSYFPKTSEVTGGTVEDVAKILDNPDINQDSTLSRLAQLLGVEIPKAAQQAASAIDNVNQVQEQLNVTKTQEPPQVDDSIKIKNETTKIDEQNRELQDNISLKAQADKQGGVDSVAEPSVVTTQIKAATTKTTSDTDVHTEISNLDGVESKIADITSAVNTKTQAFLAEKKAVKKVVQSEVHALGEVEKKVIAIGASLGNISTKQNKIDMPVVGDVENTASQETKQKGTPARNSNNHTKNEEEVRLKKNLALEKEIGQLRAKVTNAKSSDESKALKEEIRLREIIIEKLKKGVQLSAQEETFLKKRLSLITQNAQKEWNAQVAKSRKDAGLTSAKSAYRSANEILTDTMAVNGVSVESMNKLQAYNAELEKLKKLYDEISSTPGIVSEARQKELTDQTYRVKKMSKEMQTLLKEHEALSGDNAESMGQNLLGKNAHWTEYQKQLTDAVRATTTGTVSIKKFDSVTNTLTYTVKEAGGMFTTYKASIDPLNNSMVKVRGETTKTISVFDMVTKKVKEFSYYFTGSMMVSRLISKFREGIQVVKEIDSALVELKKVTDETEKSYEQFINTASKLGKKIGSTITDVTNATATFAKLGYEIKTATEMAEAALVYQNVGDSVESADAAAQSIISTMKGFGLEASEAMSIVDKFNEIGNNFSITSTGIGDALQRSASALSEAGNSLDESIALITAANEVVQDPESVGTALKTLTLRLRGAKTELEEAGLDAEDMAKTTASLQAKLLALTGGKVNIMVNEDAFKNSTQILREMSQVWEDMTDIEQAAALELMGGKRQANILSSIIQNFDTVEEVIESSANSSGSALRENEEILDSIEGKTRQFTNSVQSMWHTWIDADWIKPIIDAGTWLINKLEDFGLFKTLLLGISGAIMAMNKMGPITFVKSLLEGLIPFNNALKELPNNLIYFVKHGKTAQLTLDQLTVSQFKTQLSASGLSDENKELLLSQMGLAKANATQIVGQESLTIETLKNAVANQTLTGTQAIDIAQKYGLISATGALTAAQATQILELFGLESAQAAAIITTLGLTEETKNLTREQIINALATNGVKDAATQAALANFLLGESNKKASLSFKQLVKSMGPMLKIAAVAAVIALFVKLINDATETMEEMQTAFDDLTGELSTTKQELQELETELENINGQIDELQGKDSLTFTEQEELANLKAQSAELERQIDLKEHLREQQQRRVNDEAVKLANEYGDIGIESGKTTEEKAASGAKAGSIIGGVAGGIAGAAGAAALGAKIGATVGTFIGGPIGTAIGAVLGSVVVGGIGLIAGDAIGEAFGKSEEKVGESLDNMRSQYDRLKSEYEEAQKNYHNNATDENKEKFDEAREAFTEYEAEMSQYMSDMNDIYSQMDWSLANTDQRQEMIDWYNTQDAWAIASGSESAKTNAVTRLFGDKAFVDDAITEAVEDAKEAYIEALNNGEEISLEEAFGGNTDAFEALKNSLYDVGIYVVDAENYLKDFKDTLVATSEVDLYDVVTNLSSVSGGIESINGAIEEINENGMISIGTMESLNETFGSIDGIADEWNNFVQVIMSGTASIMDMNEVIRELAEAYVGEKLSKSAMSTAEKVSTAMYLTKMGVKNALEYIEDAQKEAGFTAISDKIAKKMERRAELEGKEELTEEENEELVKLTSDFENLAGADWIQEVAEDYGLTNDELIQYIDLLEQLAQKKIELNNIDSKANQAEQLQTEIDKIKEVQQEYDAMVAKYGDREWDNAFAQGFSAEQVYNDTFGSSAVDSGIDKEAFIRDYNALKALYDSNGPLKDLLDKKTELEAQLSELNLDPTVSDEAKEKLENEIESINNQIESTLTGKTQLELELEVTLGNVGTVFDTYTSKMQTLASIQAEVANGFTISAAKAREFAAVYPEILQGAQVAADGQITLNADVVNSFLSGKREELNATIDAEIAKIDAEIASLDAKQQLAQAQLDLAKSVAEGNIQMDAQEMVAKINNSNALVQMLIDNGMDETNANKIAYAAMSGNAQEYNEIVKTVCDDMGWNFDESASAAATTIFNNMQNSKASVVDFMRQCQEAAKAVAGMAAGVVDGVVVGTTGSGGEKTGGGNTKITYTTFEGTNAEDIKYTTIDVNGLIDSLQTTIDGYNATRNQLEGSKALLESLKNAPLDYFDPNKSDSGSGDSGSDDSGDDTDPTEEQAERFRAAMDYWENRISANQARYEQLQNEIDLLEAKGMMAGEEYYQEQIDLERERLDLLEMQKAEAEGFLKTFKEGSDEWWEVANTLNDIENEIDGVTASIQDLSDAMDQVHWDIFEESHERFGNLISQLETIRDLLSADEDSLFDDEGQFTEDGVAVLGTYIQEAEIYKNALADVNNELANLKIDDFDSEQEYYDKLTELTEKQQEYALAVSESEQSVVEMYENQIDAVEDYTSKLVESYNEYIDTVKEALDAERDLYEFRNDVNQQTKEISELERKISALSGSDNAADIAERRKLQAQLNDAKANLDDTYYSHAKDAQSSALDEESRAYEESMNNYIEKLRTTLDEATLNMDLFMERVVSSVMLNADTIEDKYNETGLAISEDLTTPWKEAAEAMNKYEVDGLTLINSWLSDEGYFGQFKIIASDSLEQPWVVGTNALNSFKDSVATQMNNVVNNVRSNVASASASLSSLYQQIQDTAARASAVSSSVSSSYSSSGSSSGSSYSSGSSGGSGNKSSSGTTKTTTYTVNAQLKTSLSTFTASGTGSSQSAAKSVAKGNVLSKAYNYYKNKGYSDEQLEKYRSKTWPSTISYYAKGTMGTKNGQWAITDEPWLGDELTMYATDKGTLSYMRAGSTVVPADLTKELIEIGEIGVDGLTTPKFNNGVNLMSNYVSKPEINLSFEALVKAEKITEDTLPEVKKFVKQEINSLVKQMNYALKGVGSR